MNVTLFYKLFIDWYKTILNEMTIMISLPNELQPFKEDNVVILEVFKATSDSVNSEPYLKSLLGKADELGIVIYLDKNPKYKQYGFVDTPNKQFMKRIPKINIPNYEVVI
jgi:hypothetical protein